MTAFPFELTSAALEAPYGCVCGGHTAPLVQTRIPSPGQGDIFLCAECVRQVVSLFAFAPVGELDALREELAAAAVRIGDLGTELARSQAHAAEVEEALGSSEIDGLRDTIAELQRTIHTQAREIAALKRGDAVSVIRESVAAIAAAARSAPVNQKASR